MSIKFALLHAVGVVAGILIPGASSATTDLTHSIQQHIADLYGEAAAKLATELKVDTTGMSGPDKVFAIVKGLVATAVSQGFKGDLVVLGRVVLPVAQAAFLKTEENIGADIVALASAIHAGPALTAVAELAAPVIQKAADDALHLDAKQTLAA